MIYKTNNMNVFKKLWLSTRFSMAGLKVAFVDEQAFRLEVFLAIILVPVAFFIEVTNVEKVLLIGSVFLLLIAELVNSAIEAVVDRISKQKHVLSGKAKDIGSAAVFLSAVNMTFVWGIIIFS